MTAGPVTIGNFGTLRLAVVQDGYTKERDGFRYPRWTVCPSQDGRAPLERYRNGGPRGLCRPVAGKTAPQWAARAVAYVARVGGLPLGVLPYLVEWFHGHRNGEPDGGLVDSWANM